MPVICLIKLAGRMPTTQILSGATYEIQFGSRECKVEVVQATFHPLSFSNGKLNFANVSRRKDVSVVSLIIELLPWLLGLLLYHPGIIIKLIIFDNVHPSLCQCTIKVAAPRHTKPQLSAQMVKVHHKVV